MLNRILTPLLALFVVAAASPAAAIVDDPNRWIPNRRPGGAIKDAPIPPFGWRLGYAMASPWASGLTVGYVWPAAPVGVKVAATWSPWTAAGFAPFALSDGRLYGSLLYYLTPTYGGGPYFEAGLGLARSTAPVWNLGWPALPHLGFGTTGRLGDDGALGWDLSFGWVANNTFVLESAFLF